MRRSTHFLVLGLLATTWQGDPGGLSHVVPPSARRSIAGPGGAEIRSVAGAEAPTVQRRLRAMGTELNLVVRARNRTAALVASDAAYTAVNAAEERLSTWTQRSELSRVNNAPTGEAVQLSPQLARDLSGALDCARATGGAFAPGIGALVQAWGLRSGGRLPGPQEISAARSAMLLTNVNLTGNRIVRLSDRFHFEEGGFGKGVGLDDAMITLAATDATGAILDLGGQVAVWGDLVSDVALADPRHRHQVALRMSVDFGSVATTGNSERGIVVDGQHLGHVLDPRTGRPSVDFGSLTVWANVAATADCLATGLYVLGPEAALCWASGRDDVAVVVIRETQRGLEALASPVLEGRLTPVADDLLLEFPAALPNCETRMRNNEPVTLFGDRTEGTGANGDPVD